MPGALVYTDARARHRRLQRPLRRDVSGAEEPAAPGRPYPDFLRHLAENGYYGRGDVDALVAARVESLRNPTGKTFEDRTPDGRTYTRCIVAAPAAGGTVTAITDVTES